MSEKRMSTRNRGEPPLKKRALTPTPPPPPRSAPKSAKAPPPEPPEIKEEGLPTKLVEGRPLPTVPEPQDVKLSLKAFQSISESGVLAASIDRSKQRWLAEGIFEKYWTRPLKKAVLNPSNPPKETMSKLGICSLIIEPHVFDVTLYTVKDLLPTPPVTYSNVPPPPSHYSPFPQNPSYTPPVYSGPFTGTTDSPSQNPFTPFKENFNRPGAHPPPPSTHYSTPPSLPQAGPPGPPPMRRASSGNKGVADNPQSDPVIQILATRAASDNVLKNLMKVVASGQANPDQLKEFQSHIDEINASLKNRQNSQSRKSSSTPKHVTPDDPLPSVEVNSSPPAPAPARPALPPTNHPPGPSIHPFKAEPLPQIYPPAPLLQYQPKPKPLTTKPDIHSIVFDFSTTSDRFLIPRLSIAEYLPGNCEVILSFLVIRKGSTAASPSRYNKNRSYYQPVTIRLTCSSSRILEPIARVLAPQDEVRRYMGGVFDKMLPAESVYLATRLPRSKDGEESDDEDVKEQRGKSEELVRAKYDPPSSLVPIAA